jgi:hypothetical protein
VASSGWLKVDLLEVMAYEAGGWSSAEAIGFAWSRAQAREIDRRAQHLPPDVLALVQRLRGGGDP